MNHALQPALQQHPHARAVSTWLLCVAASVFIMALIGAITRLTESGLSMVEWQPFFGVLPPLDAAEWQRVFGLYQLTPEYQLKNAGMALADFKIIFFWEWLHRTWGHVIGIVFLLPFLYFLFTKKLPRQILPRVMFLFVLGGLQAGIGWIMVASGLNDRPSVSHYKLALHLGNAFVIYTLTLWLVLMLRVPQLAAPAPSLRRALWWLLAPLALTMVYGAFVAGLDAGYAYNTFPLMHGTLLPSEAWSLTPTWHNFLQNTAMVQFVHRWLAIGTAVGLVAFALHLRATDKRAGTALLHATLLQVALGVATLVSGMNIVLATLHQAGALVLLSCWTYALWRLSARPAVA